MNIAKRILNKAHDTVMRAMERHDLSQWDVAAKADIPIYGVYHVYCDKGWRTLVADQIEHLRRSGLLDMTSKLYISCITADPDVPSEIVNMVGADKAELASAESDPACFEYPALSFVRQKSMEEDCLIYYFHTKGITYQAINGADRRFNSFKRNIESWRKMMEFFLFDKWNVAVNALTSGYDVYGCYRLPPPPKAYYLYAGNFWWGRSGYLKTLQAFDLDKLKANRFFAEEWLYTGKPKDFSAFDSMADLYYVNMDEELYAAPKLPVFKWMRFVFLYNFRKMRKQYFHHDYKARYQRIYQKLRSDMAQG